MRFAPVLLAALVLAGCGSKKPDPYEQANLSLLNAIPAYPGSAAPKTTTSGSSNTKFGARDWTLPAGTTQVQVTRFYEQALTKRGWKITGESFGTIRAVKGDASISVGARGRTLEIVANARGS